MNCVYLRSSGTSESAVEKNSNGKSTIAEPRDVMLKTDSGSTADVVSAPSPARNGSDRLIEPTWSLFSRILLGYCMYVKWLNFSVIMDTPSSVLCSCRVCVERRLPSTLLPIWQSLAYANPFFDGASFRFRNFEPEVYSCSLISLVDVDDIALRWRTRFELVYVVTP